MILLLIISGCGPSLNYHTLDQFVDSGDCTAASEYLEKARSSYGRNMELNYLLDAAMTQLRCGNHAESNRYFHEAEELAQKLWTISVTREAVSFLANDYALPYGGEDFERALINLLSALNYAAQGERAEALVECRRLDTLLQGYNEKYDKKNIYKEDALGRYLSGILYESEGNLDDAYIDYYKAFQTYRSYEADYGTRMPESLKKDLFRIARATGRKDEIAREIPVKPEGVLSIKETRKMGKLVLIHLNGTSPVKEEEKLTLPSPSGPVSMAFPKYRVSAPACRESRLYVTADNFNAEAAGELAEDINGIAVKNLDDRKGRVIVKTLARAAAKQAVIHKASENEAVRTLFNVLNTVIVEKADTRSWRTLPGEIYLSILYLPEGTYRASAGSCGATRDLGEVVIKKGGVNFLIYDTI